METEVVTLKTSTGREINVEVEQIEPAGVRPVGLGSRGDIDIRAVLEAVRSTAAEIHESIANIPVAPDTCEIAFGLKLSASAGVLVAKAATEANFSIKLQWKK